MNMEYFFRAVQDPNFFMPSWMKISVTVGLIVVMLLSLFIKNKERAIKIGLCLSLCQQFILYSWYIGTGYHLATEGLPLFHCRICMLGLAFAYFAKKEKLVNYFAILGLICGSMACIVVDLDHFVFPHWTNFSYVVGHYLLVFNAFMLVRERSKIQVKDIIIITLIMNLFILVADLSLKANYGFLMNISEHRGETMKNKKNNTRWSVQVALMAAIIILLANTPLGMIQLPIIKATTVHIPVIVGAITLGPVAGAILGGVFGLCSLVSNTMAPSLLSFAFSPFLSTTGLVGVIKALWISVGCRILIGLVAGCVWTGLKGLRVNQTISLVITGFVGSITNTILVMSSIYLLFAQQYAAAKQVAISGVFKLIMATILGSGIPEAPFFLCLKISLSVLHIDVELLALSLYYTSLKEYLQGSRKGFSLTSHGPSYIGHR